MPDITVVFDPPLGSDEPTVFDNKARDVGLKLGPFATQANALAAGVNADRLATESAATTATSAKNAAESARDAALAAAIADATTFQAATAYALNDLVWNDNTAARLFRCILGYAGGPTLPADDPTHWQEVFISPAQLAAVLATATAAATAADARLDVPQVSKTAAYTLALTDRGKSIDTTAAVTIPANATVAFPVGAVIMVNNMSGSNISISAAAGVTLRLAGTAATGTRTLAQYGSAHLRKVAADEWRAGGSGLS